MKFGKLNSIFTKGAILLTIFMLVISSFLFMPQKANAQFLTHDVPKAIGDAVKWAWEKGGAVAYRNALNFFLQQAAQQTGEWLATGDAGKKPTFLTDPDFFNKVGDQMLGEFINAAADDFLGLNLCETLDPTIKFNILAGLDPEYQKMKWAEEPQCSFNQIKKNLEDASKKQLFEFSTEVKEGKVAKQKATISTLIQGDSILTRDIKNFLDGKIYFCPGGVCPDNHISWEYALGMSYYDNDVLGVGAYLHTTTQDFEQELEKVKKLGEEINEAEKSGIAIALKELLKYIDNNVWGNEADSTKLKYWEKYTAECLKQNAYTVCSWYPEGAKPCWRMCHLGSGMQDDCNGSDCLAVLKRANKYTKQLVEWATTLQDMIAKTIKNWEDQQGLPDLDPLQDAENMLNPESNAMGIQMELESKLFDKQMKAIEKSKVFRDIQGSMNAITSKVSGLVKLPSNIVSEKTRKLVDAGDASALTYTGVALADAVGVFANSFLTNFMKKLMKGLNPAVDSSRVKVPKDPLDPPDPDTTSILSEIKVIPINQTSNEMTIYDEFAVCPTGTDQKYISQFNCLLDNKLARAVEERMTIQEAMDSGLLNPGERLGIVGDTRSLLSKSHIQKLRLIGVMPLGMQIATEIIMRGQYANGMILADVIEGFDQRGADGICGNLDPGESEFCNLIDPNWVLKAPSYLCEITGYSAIPLRDSSFRQETCLDLKTCINEGEGNQCDTWSYCTREKNVWRFGGDECDTQYNTCASYTQEDNKEIFSYLSNTLDFDNCSSSNVGCKWYCSKWDQRYSGIDGNWSCLSPGWRQYTCYLGDLCDTPSGCDCVCSGDNGCPDGLGTCSVVEAGMSCFLDRPELRNVAFFSNHIQECKKVDEGCSQYIRVKSGAGVNFLPNGSFELPSQDDGIPFGWQANGPIQQIAPLSNAQHSSNVAQVQAGVTSVCELSQVVNNVPIQGDFIVSGYYKRNNALSGSYNLKLQICYNNNCADLDEDEKIIELDDNGWEHVSVSLSSDIEKSIDHIKIFAFDSSDFKGDIYIDSLQLRNEIGNSIYRDYGSRGIVYLNSAPEWMNCYDGDENNNNGTCDNFIQECEQTNIGCELYSPIESTGYPIPAIISDRDACNSACIGYQTFEEMPTNFVSNNNQWVYLIPSTAEKCSAPGCEQFTNIDAVSTGGEGKEYYTYLRQCVKNNAQGLAIVDSAGNEIAPASADTCEYYYTWVGEETNGYQLKKYYLESDSSLGGPVQVSLVPNSEWGLCNEDSYLYNPHCRQFYDAMGNVYYRLYKNTRTCSQDCSPYRREVDDTTHMAIKTEGEICGVQDVGCREYKGAAYGNMRNLLLDRFISSADPWENVEINEESINRLGQSIKADANLARRPVNGLIQEGEVYSLSLWVKGSGSYVASFGSDIYFIIEEPHNISVISNEWQEIKFGSVYFNRNPEIDEKLIIQGPNNFYLDNIILNEVQDNVYLIKNSWDTPKICDTDLEGNILPGYALGCQAYWDRSNSAHYLKSFSRLCPEEAVGCEAMINTQNSISAFSEEFNSGSPQGDEIVIPADSLIYRVYDTDKSCAANKKGCQKFGLPELDSNQEAIGFTDIYLLNNPDLYELQSILCDINGEGCQEYEGQIYFKEPGDNICEYRKNVFINGENKNGWFKRGTSRPCYIEDGFAYQPYGSVYGIRTNTDSLYEGIAGICPENQGGCTQFINPVEQNLVLNSGFELDENIDGVPDDWIRYADPESSFSLASDDCLSGSCWQISHIGNATSAGRQHIAIQSGLVYELSAWMKASDTSTGTSKISLAYDDIDGNEVGFEFSEQLGHTDGKWVKHTVVLKAPYDAEFARILAPEVNDLMDIKIDNISLIEQNSPKGSYYYLNDNNIDKTSCNAMVGLKEGCVLFNDTSISENLFYDSASTYVLSQDRGDVSVPASSVSLISGGEGDSNAVFKVRRDRVCGEWLQCSGYRSVWDSSIDEFRSVCDSWVRCDQLIGSGKQAQCGHVVFNSNPVPLTEKEYKSRNVSWSGMDYSGYSIPDMYPIERLFPSEDAENAGLYYLTYFVDTNNVGVNGIGLNIPKSAHIYPEQDSPFKASVGTYYSKVSLCDSGVDDEGTEDYTTDNLELDGDGNVVFRSLYPDCQGSYQKVEYGDQYSGVTKYYNFDIGDVSPRKACKYSGKSCDDHEDCNPGDEPEPDKCVEPSKITQVIGLRGFCLEPDESRPEDTNACITWWPGASAGDVDVYNLHYSAGYVPKTARNWYCNEQSSATIPEIFTGDDSCGSQGHSDYCCWATGDGWNTATFFVDIDYQNLMKENEISYISTVLGADDGNDCTHSLKTRFLAESENVDVSYYSTDCTNINQPVGFGTNECGGVVENTYSGPAFYSSSCSECSGDFNNPVISSCLLSGTCSGGTNNGKDCTQTPGDVVGVGCATDDCDNTNDGICVFGNTCFPCLAAKSQLGNWFACSGDDYSYTGSCSRSSIVNATDPLIAGRCTQDSDGGKNNGGSCVRIMVYFDGPNNTLKTIKVSRRGTSAGADRQYWNGDLEVHLKNGCQYLVNTVPEDNFGLAIGYTNKLWSSGPEDSYYNLNGGLQECTDYGAANITDPNRLTFVGDITSNCIEGYANVVYSENSLQNLFMKIDERKSFNTNAMSYNIAESSWNETNSADPDDAPTITSVNGIVNAVSVGEYEFGSIGPETSPYVANLKFYAWANTNHMPIREISIDWDDLLTPNPTFYNVISKNHRPECCESEIFCDEFGLTPQACVDKYFSFNHTYTCKGENSENWEKYPNCSNMCCFQPKVYIKDNWGWCAGIPGVYVGWNPDTGSAYNCKDWEAGIPYNGIIKVNTNN